MSEQRLRWLKVPLHDQYKAFNQDGDEVGYLYRTRVGRFMHWCWVQSEGYHMSPGCLEEVRQKQKQLAKEPKPMWIASEEEKEGE